ncbi:MAG TPA: Crp/Fnr family transcriptional regulator [Kineosporiaceae bacterium]|nr:Crp/Fnr family transcriptional regulator [Kineosporiaceae bacterium]
MELDTVRRSALLSALDEQTAAQVLSRVAITRHPRGEVLFAQDDPAEDLQLLVSGKVKLTRTVAGERERVLAVVAAGEIFGETCLLEGTPRAATATALCDGTVAVISRPDVDLVIAANPEVVTTLMQVMARRLRNANELLSELAFRDVPGRVARALVDLTARFGEPTVRGTRVCHGLTQEELAQLVGASREAVNKALSDFGARGWLRLEQRGVTVTNLDRLRRRAHLVSPDGRLPV